MDSGRGAISKISLRMFGLNNWAAVMISIFIEMAYPNKELFQEQLRKDSRVPFCLLVKQSAWLVRKAFNAQVRSALQRSGVEVPAQAESPACTRSVQAKVRQSNLGPQTRESISQTKTFYST